MAAYLQDRKSALLERRTQYEIEVARALRDEDEEEQEERLCMVRASQAILAQSFQCMEQYNLSDYKV